MSTFVGVILTIVLFVFVLRGILFLARLGRRAAHDVSNYANGRPYGTTHSRVQHRSVAPKPTFTQDELDYLAAHVPASAGKQRPLKGAGRIDLRNTTEKDR